MNMQFRREGLIGQEELRHLQERFSFQVCKKYGRALSIILLSDFFVPSLWEKMRQVRTLSQLYTWISSPNMPTPVFLQSSSLLLSLSNGGGRKALVTEALKNMIWVLNIAYGPSVYRSTPLPPPSQSQFHPYSSCAQKINLTCISNEISVTQFLSFCCLLTCETAHIAPHFLKQNIFLCSFNPSPFSCLRARNGRFHFQGKVGVLSGPWLLPLGYLYSFVSSVSVFPLDSFRFHKYVQASLFYNKQ